METAIADVSISSPDAPATVTDSSPVGTETPSADLSASASPVTTEGAVAEQPDDPLAGIPALEELQTQAEMKTPYAEGLLKLRTAYEASKAELEPLSKYKSLTDLGEPEELQAAHALRQKLFSPVINKDTNQPEYDARGLQVRTSQPFLAEMEAENPGFIPRHLNDVLNYQYKDPVTGETDNLLRFHFKSLGLDPDRYDEYRNIDSLLAKSNGAVSQAELDLVPEPDREAYKTLPQSVRSSWDDKAEDEQRYLLDGAKERLEARQWREQQEQEKQQAAQQHQQQFQQQLQQTIYDDLSTVRKEGLTALRDNLAKAITFSGEQSTNENYIDAIVAPLALLITPELQDLGTHMLERMGVKLDQGFNETLQAFVIARQEFKRAEAYGDQQAANLSLREANGKFAKIMAKFNELALTRAKSFGLEAKKIATSNGNAIAAAGARPTPGNGSAVEANQGILPEGMSPYSSEANRYLWQASQQSGQ